MVTSRMDSLQSRIAGAGLLCASGLSTLAHRAVFEAVRQGPAHVAEFALGLLTFVLASTGVLLLIHGDRLFRRVVAEDCAERKRPAHRFVTRLLQPIEPAGRAFDTRHGASMMQARHAIDAARGAGEMHRGALRRPVTVERLRPLLPPR